MVENTLKPSSKIHCKKNIFISTYEGYGKKFVPYRFKIKSKKMAKR